MANRITSPQPGRTYVMETSDGRTIIFMFVNVGHYRVNGQDVHVANHGDLASPYAIASGPFEYSQP
jgi:hypothetical protein